MKQIDINILNYENKILQMRKELNDLIFQYHQNSPDDKTREIMLDKINYIQTELNYLNNQVSCLKREFQVVEVKNENVETRQEIRKDIESIELSIDKVKSVEPQNHPNIKEKKDFEKIFGKSFMGVFASVLIFVSVILFSTLMLPYLTDTLKLIGLYGISFFVTIFSLLKLKNTQYTNSKFYLALSACGLGALYITLILSNTYFRVFGEILLYFLLFIWAVFVHYLSKWKSFLFEIIGQIGVTIAILFGSTLCANSEDIFKFTILIVFFFVTEFIFRINLMDVKCKLSYKNNLSTHIAITINCIVLFFTNIIFDPISQVSSCLLAVFLLIEMILSYIEAEGKGIAYTILNGINIIILPLFITSIFNYEDFNILGLLVYLLCMIYLYIYNEKPFIEGIKIANNVYICGFLMLFTFFNETILHYLIPYIIVIPLLLYGITKKNRIFPYFGFFYSIIYLFTCNIIGFDNYEFFACVGTVLPFILLYIFINKLHKAELLTGYINYYFLTSIAIVPLLGMYIEPEETSNIISFILLIIIELCSEKLTLIGKSKEGRIVCHVIHGILMLAGIPFIYTDDIILRMIVIFIMIGLYLFHSKNLLEKFPNLWAGFYIGIKYTFLMILILSSFDTVNYGISVFCLIFAILSIMYGFYSSLSQAKAFRLYGLILSMLSVVKLIMIDIDYENTLGNAFSFFISGVLCFVISFIYNKIDKQVNKTKGE